MYAACLVRGCRAEAEDAVYSTAKNECASSARGSGSGLTAHDGTQSEVQVQAAEQPQVDLEYARELVDVLVDRQASDVVLLDLSHLAAFADAFVIATVDNVRQAGAIVDALSDAFAQRGRKLRAEGNAEDGWILIDAGSGIFVHLFSLEARVYYDLEGLWHRAHEVVRIQ